MPNNNPEIIQLLDRKEFAKEDFRILMLILNQDPTAASQTGSHNRSTIWVCCQHSDCDWRRAIIPPVLTKYSANVNEPAGNGFTPTPSLYNAWKPKTKEHKRKMAWILIHECGATIPNVDAHGNLMDIQDWLAGIATA